MRKVPSTTLKQSLGDVLDVATHEPVTITTHNRPRFVLMSYRDYQRRFPKDERLAIPIEETPDDHLAMLEAALADLPHEDVQ